MREEDEIRAAVVALAEAVERGEVSESELLSGAGLPAGFSEEAGGEGNSLGGPEAPEVETLNPVEQRERAIAAVLDAVRAATRDSRLSQPAEWEAQGLVPQGMTAEDLEMAVYERLMEAGGAQPEGASERRGAGAVADGASAPERPRNKHVDSPFSSSNGRAVGAPAFKRRHAAVEAPADADEEAPSRGGDDGEADAERAVGKAVVGLEVAELDAVGPEMAERVVDGAESQGISGAVLSASTEAIDAEAAGAASLFPECEGIRLLMGATSYYLYDSAAMTDSYARWAFLAAEDDPVATFVECVREESAVYPRPMARATLANDPFRLDAAAVEEAFAVAVAQGRAEDIERLEASNGDVYFFSTRFLTPVRAQALAEWDAVERRRNV
ncbi:MAG: hypothetical protein UCH28_10500 [Adlercreutzia sp.]|nr:hypothetical protein [Adlercreutzia sp.]